MRRKFIRPAKRLKIPLDLALLDRFREKIKEVPCETIMFDTCWQWQGTLDKNGWGQFRYDGQMRGAHRVSYAMFVNVLPEGWDCDHVCRNKACVKPSHLLRKPRELHNRESGKKRHECDAPF